MIQRIEESPERVVFQTPLGQVGCYKAKYDFPKAFAGWPDRPWHLVGFGIYFANPEEAETYLGTLDYTEPTDEELALAKAAGDAAYRQYMLGVEYVCGIKD